jgi:hypothetical protein
MMGIQARFAMLQGNGVTMLCTLDAAECRINFHRPRHE